MSEGPDEDVTIKSPLTPVGIKRLLINPDIYNYIELTIKSFRTVEYLIPEGRDQGRYIKTLLTLQASDHGPRVLEHLLEYGGYTYREIQLKLGVPKSTIHYITNRLIYLGWVESKTVVLPHDPKTKGIRPIVWVIVGGDPQLSVNCIQRYYGLLPSEVIESKEPAIIYEISELGQSIAETWINYYRDRDFLEPSPGELKRNITQDAPSIKRAERESIVRHIIQKVSELREADS